MNRLPKQRNARSEAQSGLPAHGGQEAALCDRRLPPLALAHWQKAQECRENALWRQFRRDRCRGGVKVHPRTDTSKIAP